MRFIFAFVVALTLAACGESPEVIAERDAQITQALTYLDEDDGVKLYIANETIVMSLADRLRTDFTYLTRDAALAANKATGEKVTLYAIDSIEAATGIPEKYLCKITALNERVDSGTC